MMTRHELREYLLTVRDKATSGRDSFLAPRLLDSRELLIREVKGDRLLGRTLESGLSFLKNLFKNHKGA